MKNHKLVKRIPDGNGYKDTMVDIAISNSKDKLNQFAINEYGVKIMPDDANIPSGQNYSEYHIGDTFWDGWLELKETKTKIV